MRITAIALAFLTLAALPIAGQELIERTLALVAGQVVTLADVRGALQLGLVSTAEEGKIEAATERLIDRVLMLREIQHYAPAEPADAALARSEEEVRARFPSAEAFARALETSGFTEARLRAWLRDDLRIAAYLEGRFAAAEEASDEEVAAYYEAHRAEFERDNVELNSAQPLIRERLGGARRRELVGAWLADLKRRVEIRRIGA